MFGLKSTQTQQSFAQYYHEICGVLVLLVETILNAIPLYIKHKVNSLNQEWKRINTAITFSDKMKSYGYPEEIHHVTTEDGYILEIHRIPHGLNSVNLTKNRPAAILLPGLGGGSHMFFMQDPKKNFACVLADAGYDVWMMNYRGNIYSQKHKTLSPDRDHEKFWQFSVHEFGVYDTSATFDYVSRVTGQENLYLVGLSMGGLVACIFLSTRPQYNQRIKLAVFFGPAVIFTHHLPIVIRVFASLCGPFLKKLWQAFGYSKYMLRSLIVAEIFRAFHTKVPGLIKFQQKLLCYIFGFIKSFEMNYAEDSTFAFIVHHYPLDTSVNAVVHYEQMYESGNCCQFDYGYQENILRYNSIIPPIYQLDKVTAQTVIYYGLNDGFVTVEDVRKLMKLLPNVEGRLIDDRLFGHQDFMIGPKAKEYVFDQVIDLLNDREKQFSQ